MAKLLALYHHPEDTAAFDAHYFDTHVPLAKAVPGLRGYEVSQGPVVTPDGKRAYHLSRSRRLAARKHSSHAVTPMA